MIFLGFTSSPLRTHAPRLPRPLESCVRETRPCSSTGASWTFAKQPSREITAPLPRPRKFPTPAPSPSWTGLAAAPPRPLSGSSAAGRSPPPSASARVLPVRRAVRGLQHCPPRSTTSEALQRHRHHHPAIALDERASCEES